MDELHAEVAVALGALLRFIDATLLDKHLDAVRTVDALEKGLLELWDDGRAADDHAADANQLVDVDRVEVAHVVYFLESVGAHLEIGGTLGADVSRVDGVVDHLVHDGDDLMREGNQMGI